MNPNRSQEDREREKARKAAKKARQADQAKTAKTEAKKKEKKHTLSAKDEADGWVLEDGTGKKKAPVVVAKPEPAEPAETKITVTVEAKKVGMLIGPKGSTLNMIQTKTDTKIDIPQGSKDSSAPIKVQINGEPQACQDAKKVIEDMCTKGYSAILMGDDFVETTIDVHPQYCHAIVGKQGAVIRAIRDIAGAILTMPENSRNATSKRVKIGVAGPKASVLNAKDIITAITRVYHHPTTHPGVEHTEIDVPWEYLNVVIGRGGSEIRHIQANFKVEVHVPNADSINQNVVVVGPKSSVPLAEKYIRKIIQNAIERPTETQEEPVDKFGDESSVPHEEWMDEYLYRRPNTGW
jgi:rRNA processing protein Krr1/Pno1